jgi:hypothetical protein
MNTPRTDAAEWDYYEDCTPEDNMVVLADFARTLERRAIAAEAKLAKWGSELSKVMPADFKDWWQNSREEWPEIARMVIEGLHKQVKLADRAAEARVKELEEANTDLIQRLQERVESYLAASKRDVQTIQQQAVELDRLRAALRLRPIAEAGPVPEGAVRLRGLANGKHWGLSDVPWDDDTHFIDIYPPQQ